MIPPDSIFTSSQTKPYWSNPTPRCPFVEDGFHLSQFVQLHHFREKCLIKHNCCHQRSARVRGHCFISWTSLKFHDFLNIIHTFVNEVSKQFLPNSTSIDTWGLRWTLLWVLMYQQWHQCLFPIMIANCSTNSSQSNWSAELTPSTASNQQNQWHPT